MTSVKSLCRPTTADMITFLANLTINVLTFWAGYVLFGSFDGNLATSNFNTSQYILTDRLSTGVQHQMAIEAGEIIEVDSDSDSDSDKENLSMHEVIQLCECLKKACIKHSRASSSPDLPQQLQEFYAFLRHTGILTAKQSHIDKYFFNN
jgi:hypothetical protein